MPDRMRPHYRFVVLITLGLASCASTPQVAPSASSPRLTTQAITTAIVDPTVRYQTMEGWGTSLSWWANMLGGWSDAKRGQVMDLIFNSPMNGGLGFNIARYNIGGGQQPGLNNLQPATAVPGYKSTSTAAYNWNADANQRRILLESKSRGVNIFEAQSYSPPWWMTISGDVAGAVDAGNNLKDDSYGTFAQYLVDVVQHFKNTAAFGNIQFRTLEAMNEPVSGFWKAGGAQEGAGFDRSKQQQLIKEVGPRLASAGLSTTVAASDENSIDQAVDSFNSLDSVSRGYLGQVNTHSYYGTKRKELGQAALDANKRVWQSEYGMLSSYVSPDDTTNSLTLASTIRDDLKYMRAVGWVAWQAVEPNPLYNGGANNSYGLIRADYYNGTENYSVTKQYYSMAQYSRFIRPGYQIINIGDSRAVAAYSASDQKVVIVFTNDTTTPFDVNLDLTRFGSTGSFTAYRTSASENLANLGTYGTASRSLVGNIMPRSITTFVISGVTAPPAGVFNPGFESNWVSGHVIPDWSAIGPNPSASFTDTAGPHSGNMRGTHYASTPYEVGTAQTVTGLVNGSYTVSAWVKSSGGQTSAYMFAKDYGGTERDQYITTASINPTGLTNWTQINIPNVSVTNGQLQLGFYSYANAGNYIEFDDVTLSKQ